MPRLSVLFGNHARGVSRTLGSLLLLALVSGMALAPAADGQPFPANMCAADRSGSDLGCTANDINIATVTVNNGVTSCAAGTSVTLDLSLLLRSNANQRFDIGVFVALDGKSPIIRSNAGGSASCFIVGLPASPPPLANLDGNACGDINSSGPVPINIGTVTVPCTPDALGNLVLPAVVTWDNSSNATSCQAPPAQWVQASTKSNCSAGITARIPVTVTGRITVVKNTTPSGSPGSFAFSASGPAVAPATFSLAAGQQQVLGTASLTPTPQVYTVTEQAAAGFDLSSLQCIDDLDNQTHPEFVTVDLATRTATIRMSSIPTQGLTSATCSFNNTRQSSITVVKKTVGGDATFQFNGPSPFAIATQGGTGQRVFPALPPGTYTVSESVPLGWTLSNAVCTDPTGNTTVLGGTATIQLGAGEDVSCTYTDTKPGAIQVSKSTVGGDGTFTFTGPQNFQITTTSGAGGPFTLPDLAPGTYTITESVPAGWQSSGIVCTDPTNDSTTSGSIATVNVAPGEVVACTFTNTRQASVTVEKQTLGGDGTFAFTGSQSFSITTTTGNGKNTTAFASVVPGVALSIVESVPSGWTLANVACRDATSGTPVGAGIANGASLTPAAGQAINCTFNDTKSATLRIFKNAVPQSPQSFGYTLTGPTNTTFALVDSGNGANSTTFTDLPAGDYTVTESSVPGWVNTGITCSDVVEPDLGRRTTINRAAASFTAHLRFGQTVDCTFTNTQVQPGTLTIHKKGVGGDGAFPFTGTGTGVPATFTITTSGPEHTGAQSFTGLAAGTYTITETVPAGWDLAPPPIACTVTGGTNTTITPNGSSGVTIALGQTGAVTDSVACEFVNVKRGTITIAKSAAPQDPQLFTFTTSSLASTTPLPASFQLADSGTPPNSRTFDALVPTIYTVTEAPATGWRLVDVVCTGASVLTSDPATGIAAIDLQPGEDVVCTYSNAKNGTITVTKTAQGGAPGEAFAFTGALAGSIGTGQSLSGTFPDGTYAISEIVPPGWDLANVVCTGGTVIYTGGEGANPTPSFAPGDTTINVTIAGAQPVACTFTNVKRGSIRVVKNALGGDASFDFAGDRTFQVVTNGGSGENTTAFGSVPPGSYRMMETIPVGWRLTGLACTNASTVDLATATASVSVAAGENVTCTFTNARESAITITKRIKSGLSGAFAFTVPTTLDPAGTFTLTPAAQTVSASRVFAGVVPGSYTITESALPAGWTLSAISCSGANASVDLAGHSATIDLAVGQHAECIFDNSAFARVTISALSVGGTDTFDFFAAGPRTSGQFSVTTTQDSTKSGNTISSIPPGNASVAGLASPGWQLDNVSCFGNVAGTHWVTVGATTTFALAEGDAIECIYYYRLPSAIAIVVPPTIAKAFGGGSIALNATSTLTFTLTNPNAATALTGVGFSDTLPAGLVVATPNGLAGSCGGGTITAGAGSGSISLTSATLAGGASCGFSVNVTGTTAGTKNNTTGAITSVEGGNGGTASASLIVTSGGTPAPSPATPIPTLQDWALWLLGLLILVTAGVALRRRGWD